MNDEPLFKVSEALIELIGFLGIFFSAGPIGFRYSSLVRLRSDGADASLWDRMARRAAVVGIIGAVILGAMFLWRLPTMGQRTHKTGSEMLATDLMTQVQAATLVLALVGFALAAVGKRAGWPIAAVGVVVNVLRSALQGQWSRLVNPLHELSGGLWIGTLFVLLIAGIATTFSDPRGRERRGVIVADLVHGFSPMALTMGGILVLMGLITGWTHLRGDLTNLWTTPYGITLIIKLVVVAVVFALGAFNWRRQRPTLGTEDAAISVRRSSRAELTFAFIVLLITSVLVSIPSPRPPGAKGGPGGEAIPGGPVGKPPGPPPG